LCLLQAAWASLRADYGVPAAVDPLEGWIVSAPHQSRPAAAKPNSGARSAKDF
jgi:hypothetical protein